MNSLTATIVSGVTLGALLFSPTSILGEENTSSRKDSSSSGKDSARSAENPGDQDITFALERRIFRDEAVPAELLDLEVKDGIVEISGTVSTLLAKERAVELCRTVRGIRGVIDRIQVKPIVTLDDETLATTVRQALEDDPAVDAEGIEVSARDGEVSLEGTVESWAEKMLAADVVKGTRGVIGLVNGVDINVILERPDGELKAEIEGRLLNDVWVNHRGVVVEVEDGKAILSGVVGSAAERSAAYADAWVPGITDVKHDGLTVAPWAERPDERASRTPRTDEDVARGIQQSLSLDPRVGSDAVEVNMRDGVATLRGVVANLRAKRAAEEDALNTYGTRRVRNFLKVRPVSGGDDATIAAAVKRMFQRDPVVDASDLVIEVRGGALTLHGTVSTLYEKIHAEQVASCADGPWSLRNLIRVDRKWTGAQDRDIKEDIESQLWWSPYVDSDAIRVTVTDGTAILEGEVEDWNEMRIAVENAREGGARSVINRLEMRRHAGHDIEGGPAVKR